MNRCARTRDLFEFSFNNDLAFYLNPNNIPNQELVNDTISYFEKGPGKRTFAPLQFLNLFWKQYVKIFSNITDTDTLLHDLGNIPLTNLQRHILYGLLIKWFGGYPLEASMRYGDADLHYDFRSQLLDKFLNYKSATPEKLFCKANLENRFKHQAIALAIEKNLNYGLDVKATLQSIHPSMDMSSNYANFDKLYEDAFKNRLIGHEKSLLKNSIELAKLNFQFNSWLQETKKWQYGNNIQYKTFLTTKVFLEFWKQLKDHEEVQKKENEASMTKEKEKWQPDEDNICNVPFIGHLFRKHITISSTITDSYYALVPQPKTVEDKSYVGKPNHFNSPYQIKIYGAYLLTTVWQMAELSMENVNDKTGYHKNWKRTEFFKSFKEYAKGFQVGFDNFINDVIDHEYNLSNSNEIRIKKIQLYALNTFDNYPALSETIGSNHPFSQWFDDGIKGGRFYKAWYLILENHLEFAPLFNTPHIAASDQLNIEKAQSVDEVSIIIEEKLNAIRDKMSERDYQLLITSLKHYINTGKFPKIDKIIRVKTGITKKQFGWILNRIVRDNGKAIEKHLLVFAYKHISLYTSNKFDINDYKRSNLYKYFTTNQKQK